MRRWNEEAWRRGEGRARASRLQPAAALAGTAAAAAARGPWGLGPAPRRSKVCARSARVAVGTCNASLRPRGGAGAVRPALRCAPRHEPWPSPHPSVSRSVSRSSEPSKGRRPRGAGRPGADRAEPRSVAAPKFAEGGRVGRSAEGPRCTAHGRRCARGTAARPQRESRIGAGAGEQGGVRRGNGEQCE